MSVIMDYGSAASRDEGREKTWHFESVITRWRDGILIAISAGHQ